MRWVLKDGSQQFELVAPQRVSQIDAALFLRRFRSDPRAMKALREALRSADGSTLLHQIPDDEVVARVAVLLSNGRLQLSTPESPSRWPVFWFKGSAETKEKDSQAKSEKSEGPKNQLSKAPMEWQLHFSDGKAVKGFVSLFEPPDKAAAELKPDGQGHHKEGQYRRDEGYAVTLRGTKEASGKIKDADDKGVEGVEVRIEPVYGDMIVVKTDSGGAWKAEGLVEEEEFDVTLMKGGMQLTGKFVDSDDKPVAGAQARLLLEGGHTREVTSDSGGKFTIDDRVPGEGFSLELVSVSPGFTAEGKFVNEKGAPVAGVTARLHFDGGGEITVVSDEAGKYKVPGLLPGEGYSLEVL